MTLTMITLPGLNIVKVGEIQSRLNSELSKVSIYDYNTKSGDLIIQIQGTEPDDLILAGIIIQKTIQS